MDLDTEEGQKVIFLVRKGIGSDSDRKYADTHLKPNRVYTVDSMDVHDFSSDVSLKEVPGRTFNTILFENFWEGGKGRRYSCCGELVGGADVLVCDKDYEAQVAYAESLSSALAVAKKYITNLCIYRKSCGKCEHCLELAKIQKLEDAWTKRDKTSSEKEE